MRLALPWLDPAFFINNSWIGTLHLPPVLSVPGLSVSATAHRR
jgi:hypothetical protein